ncbi:MAG: hypothetical protein M3Q39_03010 [Actinomycetota bacterium]|nr:hypothetical protein [Actinomycetota bacterium]
MKHRNHTVEGITLAVRLGFVPVAREPYDLVVAVEAWGSEVLAPLRVLLADPGFHASRGARRRCPGDGLSRDHVELPG